MKKLFPVLLVLLFFGCYSSDLPEGMPNPSKRQNTNPVTDIGPVLISPALVIDFTPVPPASDPKRQYEYYLDSSCRVYAGDSGGSGVCYKIDSMYAYILTCRHVVGKNKTAKVEFWHDGFLTEKYPAAVVKVLRVDVAVITVKLSEFKNNWLPNAIPITEKELKPGDTIVSVGCAGFAWQTLFEGHVLEGLVRSEKRNGGAESFKFAPAPKGGRSGSGVFADGEITGILWGTDGKTHGVAVHWEDFATEAYNLNVKTVSDDDRPGGFFFTASWCQYCNGMKPIIEALRKEGFQIQEIDYDGNTTFAKLHGIDSLPAFVNRLGNTATGVKSAEELKEFFSSQGDVTCD
jgi:thiol-disulfide isomerase/thioredoxin